jgi:RNA polymerase-binding transcription factor DksA
MRIDSTLERDVFDQGESSEVNIQDEIGCALIQMKAETLDKIDAALGRLGEGTYGDCFECGEEIAGARLRALPFAVRCRDCEEAHERVEQRQHIMAQRRGSSAPFLDVRNSTLTRAGVKSASFGLASVASTREPFCRAVGGHSVRRSIGNAIQHALRN